MLARFSTVAGELGAADAERDVRGFALKFYTEEGNWDLVGNNTPVFFVRDPYKFPDFIHTQKRHPQDQPALADGDVGFLVAVAGKPAPGDDPDVGPRPADRRRATSTATARTPIRFINAARRALLGEVPLQDAAGPQALHQPRGRARSSASTRESYQEDLFGAIEQGDFPKWKMQVQIMPEADAGKHWYNPFDLTKVWPHADYPLIEVGVMELNRNPDNYFAGDRAGRLLAVEHRAGHRLLARQDAAGAHLLLCRRAPLPARHALRGAARQPPAVPGAPLPQGRADAVLPAARPATRTPTTSRTRSAAPVEDKRFAEPPLKISGDADRYNHRDGNDDYKQPGDCSASSAADAQGRLMDNIAEAMQGVPVEIVKRQVAHFYKADPAYGLGVATRMGLGAGDLATAEAAE